MDKVLKLLLNLVVDFVGCEGADIVQQRFQFVLERGPHGMALATQVADGMGQVGQRLLKVPRQQGVNVSAHQILERGCGLVENLNLRVLNTVGQFTAGGKRLLAKIMQLGCHVRHLAQELLLGVVQFATGLLDLAGKCHHLLVQRMVGVLMVCNVIGQRRLGFLKILRQVLDFRAQRRFEMGDGVLLQVLQALHVMRQRVLQQRVGRMVQVNLETLVFAFQFSKISFQHTKAFAQNAHALFDLGLDLG